jgi:hypothetical protein
VQVPGAPGHKLLRAKHDERQRFARARCKAVHRIQRWHARERRRRRREGLAAREEGFLLELQRAEEEARRGARERRAREQEADRRAAGALLTAL